MVEITPISIKSIGHYTYVYFCIFNAAFVPLVFFFYPETANLELEDVDLLFNGEKVLLKLPDVSADFQPILRHRTIQANCMVFSSPGSLNRIISDLLVRPRFDRVENKELTLWIWSETRSNISSIATDLMLSKTKCGPKFVQTGFHCCGNIVVRSLSKV